MQKLIKKIIEIIAYYCLLLTSKFSENKSYNLLEL